MWGGGDVEDGEECRLVEEERKGGEVPLKFLSMIGKRIVGGLRIIVVVMDLFYLEVHIG